MRPLKINLLGFESAVLKSDIPFLVLFGAVWNYESRRIGYQLDHWSQTLDGKIRTGFADLDVVPDLFSDYGVFEIPTMIIFEDGKPFKHCTGFTDSKHVENYLRYFYGGYIPLPKKTNNN